jgi:hypothetical protein
MDDVAPTAVKRQKRTNPRHKKQLDYKHQRRTTEGGKGWRKTVARLPRLERRLFRQAQQRALREALHTEETQEGAQAPGLVAGDSLRSIRRSNFGMLHHRREIPLGVRVSLKKAGITRLMYRVPHGRKKGRNALSARLMIAAWFETQDRESTQ